MVMTENYMKYDIAFLSTIIPRDMDAYVRSKSGRRMEDAAIAWQEHIIEGIEENNKGSVRMINILPIEAFPTGYKKAFIKKSKFKHASDANDVNVGFCNIKIIKRFLQWAPLFHEVDTWSNHKTKRQKVLIAYTMYPEFMKAIAHVKKKYPDIITINIVVDLPQFIALGEKPLSPLESMYQKWSKELALKNIKSIDGFAVITKQMADLICANKPYKVIEGISTNEFPPLKEKNDSYIRIIYAGLLHNKFGIIKLLDAFHQISDLEFRLIICGLGEAEDEINLRAQSDSRIKFLGQLTRKQVMDVMSGCDVIVNPRENVGEFTKYSFPSKNLEALSSGIPFIGYKLDGIPAEYDKYINYPKDESVEALAECIYTVGRSKHYQAIKVASQAKEWITKVKSPLSQGEKIIKLISQCKNRDM